MLSSCANAPVVQTKVIKPPEAWMITCLVPEPEADDVQYLLEEYIPELMQGIETCKTWQARIQKWLREMETGQ